MKRALLLTAITAVVLLCAAPAFAGSHGECTEYPYSGPPLPPGVQIGTALKCVVIEDEPATEKPKKTTSTSKKSVMPSLAAPAPRWSEPARKGVTSPIVLSSDTKPVGSSVTPKNTQLLTMYSILAVLMLAVWRFAEVPSSGDRQTARISYRKAL